MRTLLLFLCLVFLHTSEASCCTGDTCCGGCPGGKRLRSTGKYVRTVRDEALTFLQVSWHAKYVGGGFFPWPRGSQPLKNLEKLSNPFFGL